MIRLLAALLLFGVSLSAVEVHLNAVAASVTEGGSVTILATRSSNVGTLSVPVSLVVGAPTGVSLSAATFDFAAGATTATVTLDTTDDADANGARQATAQITLSPGITSTNPAVTIGIRDDDVRVSITALDVVASEDALITDTARLLIHLDDAGSGRSDTVQVQFEVHGTGRFEASNPSLNDYTLDLDIKAPPGIAPQDGVDVVSFDMPVGVTDAVITLTPLHDNAIEGGETCIIRLPTASLAYTVAGADNGTMTIADDDNRIVALTGAPAFESGPDGNIGITFLSTFPAGLAVSIPYMISGVTNGTDITILSGTATLPAGATHIDIPVDALADAELEGETLTFQLLPSPDYVLPGTPSVQIAIVDVAGMATIATPSADAVEGVPGTPLLFPVTVSRLPDFSNVDVSVPFHLAGGTAGSGEYTIGGTGVVWDAGTSTGVIVLAGTATTGSISITPVDDQIADGDKTVRVVLDSGQSVTVGGAANATGTILDDEAVVSLTRSGTAPATEGEAGITFTVSYPGTPAGVARTQAVTARFTIGGTAALADRTVSGSGISLDSDGLGGTVTIPANQLDTTITVTAVADAVAETVETVVLTLSSPAPGASYRLGSSVSGSVDVVDAGSTPTVSISSIADAIEGRAVQCCRITRTGATTAALTVKLGSAGGSASAADYLALPTSVIIPAGAPSATLAITAVADGPDSETIDVTLAADAAYVLGVDTASVTIVDGFADNQVALTSEPGDVVMAINDAWSSVCRLNLPTGLVAGRTRAAVVAVPGGSAPPSWLSVIHTSADTDTGVAVFTIVGSPPVGTTPGHVLVRLKVQADVDGDGTYELDIPQDLLLWVLDNGGAG